MNTPEESKLSDSIITSIEKGEVAMRPKWHFILHLTLLILGTILVALTLLFIASFIFFSLRQNGSWFVSDLGPGGWQAFLVSLPWILLIVATLFIIILGFLVKKYSFAYGKPLLYSALGIIIFTGIGGFLIALTPFHSDLLLEAENERLPLAGPIYREFGHRDLGNVVMGRIIETNPNSFLLYSQHQDILMIIVTPRTLLPHERIKIEDVVVVLGERHDNIVEALGIKPLTGRPGMRPPKMLEHR